MVTSLAQVDIKRMRDQLFFDGPERNRRLSRFWLLLPLSAVIASAGVVSDSTATVIGAMIVAPLMTPILGIVLAVALADGANLRRCLLLVMTGAAAVVGTGWLLGLFVPYPVVAATNSQVAARVTLQIVDLVAALATGAVGSVALLRSDISDTLPGVAIAISLVPPLAVVGLTLESGAPRQSLAAFLLFTTNVAAILASGIVVMALYRVHRVSGQTTAPAFHYRGAVAVIAALLLAVIVPLSISSNRIDKTTIRQSDVQAVAGHWASAAGWSVTGVTATGDQVLIEATGPSPAPDLAVLRQDLDAAGLNGLDVRISLVVASYKPLPAQAAAGYTGRRSSPQAIRAGNAGRASAAAGRRAMGRASVPAVTTTWRTHATARTPDARRAAPPPRARRRPRRPANGPPHPARHESQHASP